MSKEDTEIDSLSSSLDCHQNVEQVKQETSSPSQTMTSAPMTRRSISTRSAPNNAAEKDDDKSRKFTAMLSENPNSWQSQANSIIQYILSQKQGYLFETEITDEIAPKYHLLVRRPIALDTIRKNLESNFYSSKDHFRRDIYLMLYNAMKYNPRYHQVHRSAKQLFNQSLPLFQLSAPEIQAQITRRNSVSHSTSLSNETPAPKRKRIKVSIE